MSRTRQARLRPLCDLPPDTLLVSEIFASIQGESTYAGRPCGFVRVTGCNLRCTYCDTTYAYEGGARLSVDAVMSRLSALGLPLIEVTGGEPLLQPAVPVLLSRLCDAGLTVLLETNGSLELAAVDPRVVKIVDLKAPSSGEARRNRMQNLERLAKTDELKLVLAGRGDYEWARRLVREHRLDERCTVLFGAVHGALAPELLAAWILEDRLPVRLQLQLHKILYGARQRGV
ncbi:MAG: radical SAM protein [Deltaproteobacteria bacterium]|nr:radical SAM protein [Deltaproteobacteria bacterium]